MRKWSVKSLFLFDFNLIEFAYPPSEYSFSTKQVQVRGKTVRVVEVQQSTATSATSHVTPAAPPRNIEIRHHSLHRTDSKGAIKSSQIGNLPSPNNAWHTAATLVVLQNGKQKCNPATCKLETACFARFGEDEVYKFKAKFHLCAPRHSAANW